MDLMQLKMPPERVAKVADAIETHIMSEDAQENAQELDQVLVWLRYRLSLWAAKHPDATAA